MYWGLIVIAISVFAFAQGTGWNYNANNSYDDYVLFCESLGMEYSELKMYNYTYYILCDNFNNQQSLQATKRFIQSDADLNNKYECSITQQQEYCLSGISFNGYNCYPNRGNQGQSIECGDNQNSGIWEGVLV